MLCYRCGSYTPDDSRKCTVCGQPIADRRRASRNPSGATTGREKAIPPFSAGEILAARYRIRDAVAPGSTGWVLRARDDEVDIDVAVKVVATNLLQTEEERGQFFRAVKAARGVQHPNVVRLYDEGQDERFAFYTMQFLEGLSLRKIIDLRLEKKQVFSFAEALPLFGQLAVALDALQGVGCHGALRPVNVVVLPDVVKVTGLAHHSGLPRRPFVALQSKAGMLEYMAPEARRDDTLVDRRADIYSMAVIFAEMVTGVVYGRDAHAWEEAEKRLPRKVVAALRRATAEAATSRFDTAAALFDALAESALEMPPPAGPQAWLGPEAQASLDDFSDEVTPPGAQTIDLGGKGKKPEIRNLGAVEIPSRPSVTLARPHGRRSPFVWAATLAILATGIAVSAAIWKHRQDSTPAPVEAKPLTTPLAAPSPTPAFVPPAPAVPPAEVAPPPAAEKKKPSETKRGRDDDRRPRDEEKAPRFSSPEPERRPLESDRRPIAPPAPPPEPERRPVGLATPPPESERRPVSAPTAAGQGCPPGMALIEAGSFDMGSRPSDPMRGFDELLAQRRRVEAYCIDIYEYPNERGRQPQAHVTWARAKKACEKAGKRLCSEIEWERACKGPEGTRFPFGDEFVASTCNVSADSGGQRRPGDAGVFSRCRSGFGAIDMAGNVAEWTASQWSKEVPDKVVKGGSADQAAFMARCAARVNESSASHRATLGFRCCMDVR